MKTFGHPRGLLVLSGTEMWERLSYYGMRALLMGYLTKYLLLPGHVEHVLFYGQVKHLYEWIGAILSFAFQWLWHWLSLASVQLANPIWLIGALAILVVAPVGFEYSRNRHLSTLSKIIVAILTVCIFALAILGWAGVTASTIPVALFYVKLAVQPFASLIYGTYTGLIYATPLLGGWLADRWFGQRAVAMVGMVLMAAGHFMMASEALLFPALTLLIFGGGFFKTNTSSQVGFLYANGDPRRDGGYAIFYIGVNLGAFLAPFVCGTLGEEVGWHYGFAAAGVGLLLALAVYLAGWKHLPPDGGRTQAAGPRMKLTAPERRSVVALILLVIPLTLYWACNEQQGNTLALWSIDNTDRAINILGWHTRIPWTWFQSVNPFVIFVGTPLILALWQRQGARQSSPTMKMVTGCALMAAANLLMVIPAWQGGRASWMWLAAYLGILTVGEIYLYPVGLSLFSKVAPARMASLLMGLYFVPNFLGGGFLQGWLGTFWDKMDKGAFFVMIAAIAAVAGAIIWALDRPLRPFLQEKA